MIDVEREKLNIPTKKTRQGMKMFENVTFPHGKVIVALHFLIINHLTSYYISPTLSALLATMVWETASPRMRYQCFFNTEDTAHEGSPQRHRMSDFFTDCSYPKKQAELIIWSHVSIY